MDGTIDGLRPGQEHGLAVHESGDLSGGCASVGAHFNPRGARHGSPVKGGGGGACEERHVGDLGNVRADGDGRATFRFADDLLKVWDVVGRSLVVAEGRDDLGQGGHPRSKVTKDHTVKSFVLVLQKKSSLRSTATAAPRSPAASSPAPPGSSRTAPRSFAPATASPSGTRGASPRRERAGVRVKRPPES